MLKKRVLDWLQTTQPTSGGAVTVNTNSCANCVETTSPQQRDPIYRFLGASRPCGPAGWLALLLIKAGDGNTNPGPTTSHKRVSIFDICYKQIHVWKQTSILRIHVTSLILGEHISAIILPQQRKQWLSVELNRWRSERIHCYFFNNKNRTLIIIM